jgi:hypothetical protein
MGATLVVLAVVEEAGNLLSQCKGLIFFTQRCGSLEQHSLYAGGQLVPLHQHGTSEATQDELFLLTQPNALSALRF